MPESVPLFVAPADDRHDAVYDVLAAWGRAGLVSAFAWWPVDPSGSIEPPRTLRYVGANGEIEADPAKLYADREAPYGVVFCHAEQGSKAHQQLIRGLIAIDNLNPDHMRRWWIDWTDPTALADPSSQQTLSTDLTDSMIRVAIAPVHSGVPGGTDLLPDSGEHHWVTSHPAHALAALTGLLGREPTTEGGEAILSTFELSNGDMVQVFSRHVDIATQRDYLLDRAATSDEFTPWFGVDYADLRREVIDSIGERFSVQHADVLTRTARPEPLKQEPVRGLFAYLLLLFYGTVELLQRATFRLLDGLFGRAHDWAADRLEQPHGVSIVGRKVARYRERPSEQAQVTDREIHRVDDASGAVAAAWRELGEAVCALHDGQTPPSWIGVELDGQRVRASQLCPRPAGGPSVVGSVRRRLVDELAAVQRDLDGTRAEIAASASNSVNDDDETRPGFLRRIWRVLKRFTRRVLKAFGVVGSVGIGWLIAAAIALGGLMLGAAAGLTLLVLAPMVGIVIALWLLWRLLRSADDEAEEEARKVARQFAIEMEGVLAADAERLRRRLDELDRWTHILAGVMTSLASASWPAAALEDAGGPPFPPAGASYVLLLGEDEEARLRSATGRQAVLDTRSRDLVDLLVEAVRRRTSVSAGIDIEQRETDPFEPATGEYTPLSLLAELVDTEIDRYRDAEVSGRLATNLDDALRIRLQRQGQRLRRVDNFDRVGVVDDASSLPKVEADISRERYDLSLMDGTRIPMEPVASASPLDGDPQQVFIRVYRGHRS